MCAPVAVPRSDARVVVAGVGGGFDAAVQDAEGGVLDEDRDGLPAVVGPDAKLLTATITVSAAETRRKAV
jgi:hypothetical protein